jgi:eukaryotic-like serine/threonine-protein kinase
MNYTGQSFGRYHIIDKLGEGGMATVYKAYDTRLERDVAIKVIRVDQFSPATLQSVLARFEREAKSLARLTHPNVVHISDYGEQDNVPYLVMDYLPGGTLKSRLGQPLKWQEACKLLLPIAQALGYAHEQNLIHRDVKPANILLTNKGQPMLTDFGIAKILDTGGQTLTATGVGIGTPEYMAPEQWTGKTTPQSDIYSLGVVMYEMLTGRTPFSSDTPAAILLKQATEPLPRPMQYAQDLPEAVEKVLIKALAREPADRYQTMDDFARALEGLLVGVVTEEPSKSTIVATAATLTSTETVLPPEPEKTVNLKTMAVIEDKKSATETVIDSPTSTPTAQYSHLTSLSTVKSKHRWSLKRSYIIGGLIVLISFVLLAAGGRLVVWGMQGFGPMAGLAPEISIKPVVPNRTWERPADGMVMVNVPEGEFLMGSVKNYNEEPIHKVYLDAYWIDQTEVTNAMFAAFLNEKGNQSEGGNTWYEDNYYKNSDLSLIGNTWVVKSGYENNPASGVSWYGAKAYCERAGARLPTEAEWEKAAGGTDGRQYPWGNSAPNCDLANGKLDEDFWGNINYCVVSTRPVGTYPLGASPYGAYDMAGNVDEWVADWYGNYDASSSNNPTGPSTGGYRVLRGGSWSNDYEAIRVSSRSMQHPASEFNLSGFRCARDETTVTPSPTPIPTQVVTPTPKSGGDLVFFDEFNSNTYGWAEGKFTDDSGTFTFTMNGSYTWEFDITKPHNRRTWAKQAPSVENFITSVDATHDSGAENASYGIVFRVKDNNNFYTFLIADNGYYYIGLLKDGKWTTLVDWKKTTTINANALNQLKVTGKGDEFAFYINDREINQVKDGSLPKGTAGLVVELYNAGDTSTFEFDNFAINNP